MNGYRLLKLMTYPTVGNVPDAETNLPVDPKNGEEIARDCQALFNAMNDDLNTAVTIGHLFSLLKKVNQLDTRQIAMGQVGEAAFTQLKTVFLQFFEDVLGLQEETTRDQTAMITGMLDLYREYKTQRLYEKVDQVRSYFKSQGLVIRDMKHRIDWAYEE